MTLDEAPADRHDAILDAAFSAFAAYGYRRTAMEDIARAAGLSRSALYLHFRNKEDLFRSLTLRYFDTVLRDMQAALTAPGQSVEQALYASFVAKDGKFMEVVLTTPHGAELLDAGLTTNADLVHGKTAQVALLLGNWLQSQGLPPAVGTPQSLAQMIVSALMGLKASSTSLDALRAGEAQLARLVAHAIGPT